MKNLHNKYNRYLLAISATLVVSMLIAWTTENGKMIFSGMATFLGDTYYVNNGAQNQNSYKLILQADNAGTEQSGEIFVVYGASPYFRISPPNDAGTATATIDIKDHGIFFTTDNTVDIGDPAANRPKNINASGTIIAAGDITGAGGDNTELTYWYQDDVPATQNAVVLNMNGNASRAEVPTVRAGSIIGISVYSNESWLSGSLTVDATIDGAVTSLTAVLNAGATQTKVTTQAKDSDTFTAGQRIGVKITTTGDWTPITADITVGVLIEQ